MKLRDIGYSHKLFLHLVTQTLKLLINSCEGLYLTLMVKFVDFTTFMNRLRHFSKRFTMLP